MTEPRIAVIGDLNPENETHRATISGLADVPGGVDVDWLPTQAVADPRRSLRDYGGILIAPGSPYRSMTGALEAVRFAREHGLPLLGT